MATSLFWCWHQCTLTSMLWNLFFAVAKKTSPGSVFLIQTFSAVPRVRFWAMGCLGRNIPRGSVGCWWFLRFSPFPSFLWISSSPSFMSRRLQGWFPLKDTLSCKKFFDWAVWEPAEWQKQWIWKQRWCWSLLEGGLNHLRDRGT